MRAVVRVAADVRVAVGGVAVLTAVPLLLLKALFGLLLLLLLLSAVAEEATGRRRGPGQVGELGPAGDAAVDEDDGAVDVVGPLAAAEEPGAHQRAAHGPGGVPGRRRRGHVLQ